MMTAGTLHALHVVLNTVDFFAWFCVCGLVLARAGLVPRAAFELPGVAGRLRSRLLGCLALMAITGGALLAVRTGEMSGLPLAQAIGILPEVLLHTHFGIVWAMHLVLLGLLAATLPLPRGAGIPAALCMAAALALTYSAVSHAGDRGDFTLSELNDWAHVISVSLWGGGILATILFTFPLLRGHRTLLVQSAVRLSRLAMWALAGSVATGLYNASLRIDTPDQLLTTDYGRTLAVKVVLVGGIAALGAFNRFFIVSRLRGAPSERDADVCLKRMGGALAGDVILIALVLLAASMLIQGMPPSSMHAMGKMAM
jgi:putative copper export protein